MVCDVWLMGTSDKQNLEFSHFHTVQFLSVSQHSANAHKQKKKEKKTHRVHTDSYTCTNACSQRLTQMPHTYILINELIIFGHQYIDMIFCNQCTELI